MHPVGPHLNLVGSRMMDRFRHMRVTPTLNKSPPSGGPCASAGRRSPAASSSRRPQALCLRIRAHPFFITARRVALYHPNDGEIDVTPLLSRSPGKQFYCRFCAGGGSIARSVRCWSRRSSPMWRASGSPARRTSSTCCCSARRRRSRSGASIAMWAVFADSAAWRLLRRRLRIRPRTWRQRPHRPGAGVIVVGQHRPRHPDPGDDGDGLEGGALSGWSSSRPRPRSRGFGFVRADRRRQPDRCRPGPPSAL